MDINLIKINKIIDVKESKPVSFKQFSVSIVPATVSAVGFDLRMPTDKFSTIDWFMTLKFVNASRKNLIVEDIRAEWIGKNNYRCKSLYTEIYTAEGEDEETIINQLNKDEDSTRQILFFPFLLNSGAEKFIQANFSLNTYKRIFFNYWKPISFKREEITPKTYQQLLQRAIIKIKINESKKPLLLKI